MNRSILICQFGERSTWSNSDSLAEKGHKMFNNYRCKDKSTKESMFASLIRGGSKVGHPSRYYIHYVTVTTEISPAVGHMALLTNKTTEFPSAKARDFT